MQEGLFQLNGSTLVGIGTVLGALCGAITFLMKALLKAKEDQVAAKDEQIESITEDRDYWRNYSMGLIGPADKALTIAEDKDRELRRLRRPV